MGKLYPVLSAEFAAELNKAGKRIAFQQLYMDENKWKLAKRVNVEWDKRRDEYEPEINKRVFYTECCKCLPVMIFGESGETLRRWCETQSHYAPEKDIVTLLRGSSFDHLLKAKRLQNNGKVEAAVLAVAFAIERKMSADDMVSNFDPNYDGNDSRHFTLNRLFTLSEKAWIPKEAAEHLLEAARIIKKSLDGEK